MKLDIACGQRKKEGFTGIDIAELPEVDIVHDLNVYPWPIESESVEEVSCEHYIEHTLCLMKFLNELHRVMKPGAKAHIVAPYYTSMRAFQDPTHVRMITEATFVYFNKAWRVDQKLEHYPITADFDYIFAYGVAPEWANRSEETRAFAIRHYWNVVADIIVTLTRI